MKADKGTLKWHSIEDAVAEFSKCAATVEAGILKMGRVYVAMLAQFGAEEAKAAVVRAHPSYATRLARIEDVGRGLLPPEALLLANYQLNVLPRLPVAEREELVGGKPIDVLATDGTARKVALKDMDYDTVRQAFSSQGVRDLPRQKTWLETEIRHRRRKQADNADEPYRVEPGKLIVLRPCTIDIETILPALRKNRVK